MLCKIDGCEDKSYKRKWCKKHYARWYRHGDPNVVLNNYEKHGYKHHPIYNIWRNMNERCYNLNNPRYKDYGGRGIIICSEWKNSAKSFIEWCLNNGWNKGLQIDRKDNDENYCPENCRFITYIENNHNCRLLRSNNTSGYRGVSYYKGKWITQMRINGKNKYLGRFGSPILAGLRYDAEAYLLDDGRPRNFF